MKEAPMSESGLLAVYSNCRFHSPLVTNQTLPIDDNTMGVALVPSFYCNPPVSAVTIVFIIISVVTISIIVHWVTAIEWKPKPDGDVIVVSVVPMHRFGGRGHGNGTSRERCGGN